MVGANGHTLYAFTDDPERQTTCFDACAEAWPPLTVDPGFAISDELQASGAATIDRPDGTKQLVMGKWALYYYAGDGAPGEANGQGSERQVVRRRRQLQAGQDRRLIDQRPAHAAPRTAPASRRDRPGRSHPVATAGPPAAENAGPADVL